MNPGFLDRPVALASSACLYFAAAALAVNALRSEPAGRAVTIEDCISIEKMARTYDPDDPSVVFSADGSRWVTSLCRGNLKDNVNDYRLLLFEATRAAELPIDVLTARFTYEQDNQHARPLTHLAFLGNDRIALLATRHGEPRSVVAVDVATRAVKTLATDPRGIVSFGISSDGRSIVYAVRVASPGSETVKLRREGYSLEDVEFMRGRGTLDEAVIRGRVFDGIPGLEYFLLRDGGEPVRIHECPDRTPKVWVSPDGRRAVMFPFHEPSAPETATFGSVDLQTGKVTRLFASGGPSASHRVLWSRDSARVIVYEAPQIFDLNVATGQTASGSVGEPVGVKARYFWTLLGWNAAGDGLIFGPGVIADDDKGLVLLNKSGPQWEKPRTLSRSDARYTLNSRTIPGTNGRSIVGIKDAMSEWPDVAVYDLATRETRVALRLNPESRDLRLGETSLLEWTDARHPENGSYGFLVKPVGFDPSRTYPLIVQWKDEGGYYADQSFILDGTEQYSGAAIQVWANLGYMVLFTPGPFHPNEERETPKEDPRIVAHIESGIAHLESLGLRIDRNRMAIAGWSRAGWWSETVAARARLKFAAAASIDHVEYNQMQFVLRGGPDFYSNQWDGLLPWGPGREAWQRRAVDAFYPNIHTPWLMESHGQHKTPRMLQFYMALKTAGVPVDFYIFPDAPHNLQSPRHRQISLTMHTDWFRFWLERYEDPSPEKEVQYRRWRVMRDRANRGR